MENIDAAFIYIITDGEDYKVGVTKNDVSLRLKQLQTGNSKTLTVVRTFKVSAEMVYRLEKEAHTLLRHRYKKRGEWFRSANEWDVDLTVDMVCSNYILD